jgi:RNA polymerase-binding transcription factor DksA
MMSGSRMDTVWRGIPYYLCINCKKQIGPNQLHIIPLHHFPTINAIIDSNNNDNERITLEPMCDTCYKCFTEVEEYDDEDDDSTM